MLRRRGRGPGHGRLGRKVAIACAVAAVTAVAAVWVLSADSQSAEAHGSTQVPASRVYSCRFEQPDDPMCAAARSADPQAIYDWMEVNIGDADGRHQQLIPDGELCSAGRDKYAAFDRPGDWPVTHLTPNSAGQYEVVYTNTAPHATAYYRLMLTREGFDARTDTLRWADLEQVYDSGPLAASPQNRFTVSLPARSQPAILYVIWQRSDSPEAFYSCSDVTIGGGGAAPSTTAPPATAPPSTGAPTTLVPPTTAPPTTAPPTTPGVRVSTNTTAEWDTGYCTEIRVENTTPAPATWEVRYRPDGTIATLWNAAGGERDDAGRIAFTGEDWNARVATGASTTFGMCVDTE
jgi:predicted carbohydrate-binding protein with CBM5 and CBM33 domain